MVRGAPPARLASVALALCSAAAPGRAETPSDEAPRSTSAPGASDAAAREVDCVARHQLAQEQRYDGRLIEALASLRECAADVCPLALRVDCTEWLLQVQQHMPTLIPIAELDGADVTDASVLLDGESVLRVLDGRAIPVNPGAHELRFERPPLAPVTVRVVAREGEKNRVVKAEFSSPVPVRLRAAAPGAPQRALGPAEPMRPTPLGTYVLGGVALAASGSATYFGLRAVAIRHDLEHACSPLCSEEEVADVRHLALLSDVSMGVAIVSAATAFALYLARPSVPGAPPPSSPTVSQGLSVRASPRLVQLQLAGLF